MAKAQAFEIKGKPLACPICGGNKFWKDQSQVERGLMQLRPERQAITLTCENCRHILWFED